MKVMFIFGTRPEAIKLAPLIKKLNRSIICVTGQHKEMLQQVLKIFNIKPKYNLNIMKKNQTLFNITFNILLKLENILKKEKPDIVIVQGDTTTTFVASLSAFYLKIPIGYVEAGLRSYDKYQPFPEEINRRLTTHLADIYFAPTSKARDNLLKEGVSSKQIFVTGNTGIDALLMMVKEVKKNNLKYEMYFRKNFGINFNKKIILVTGHRRENFGIGFKNICNAIKEIALKEDINIIYPVHLNPNVQTPVKKILSNLRNVFLLPPLEYDKFCYLMYRSYLILTDSGGIQEEAPSLGKPVLVLRNVTERKEGIKKGNAVLVGTNKDKIIKWVKNLLYNKNLYNNMRKVSNPYGDGKASNRIIRILKSVRIK
jgi:UDP-N-acetylglucosamine 2-epimerase (non-hydrolysing)